MRSLSPLPVDAVLPEILSRLEKENSLVLKAAPGSGKTTRVPPALLRASFAAPDREILVLEPRRVAAKYSARRVAWELGEEVGKTVGYQFRFENVGSRETRLRFLTEGTLLRKLQNDPTLSRVAVVVLDEFHERHLSTDTALAYLKHLQSTSRPDLKLIVMSATLDTESLAHYLGGCSVVEVAHRPHPIEVHHASAPSSKHLEIQVRDAVLRALEDGMGDILVFLPGMSEIRRAEQALTDSFSGQGRSAPLVFALHGDLSREEQDLALTRAERRKIILSTNLAETSLTIEGVTVVVDSGLHRQAAYSWWSGMPSLRTRPVSRASAIQRAGRAGRTEPGRCYRLFTRGEFDSRLPFEAPEIQRTDLSQTLLDLKALGIAAFSKLPWFEAPAAGAIESATLLLYLLGAFDSASADASITPIGKAMAALPLHPRLARFLIEAARLRIENEAVTLAALISEGRLERLDALDHLSSRAIPVNERTRAQYLSALRSVSLKSLGSSPADQFSSTEEKLRFALLTGFPDRVARVRRGKAAEAELVFCGGGSAKVENSGVIASDEFFVVLEAQEMQTIRQARAELKIRSVSSVREEWFLDLTPSLLRDEDAAVWDPAREQVLRSSRMMYGELLLSESTRPAQPDRESTRLLLRSLLSMDEEQILALRLEEWPDVLTRLLSDAEGNDIRLSTLVRASILREKFPEDSPPVRTGNEVLLEAIRTHLSRRSLREVEWATEILNAFAPPSTQGRIEALLPSGITLPSGRKTRIHYAWGKTPWVESRLQDFFGMRSVPALLGGKLPLTVHLLAPNQRAVQITTDLMSFWQKEYPELRRALSRRYPRHQWPEDPLKPLAPKPLS